MKIQNVDNSNYQRKQDVNFKATLLTSGAVDLMETLFSKRLLSEVLHSAVDEGWRLKPAQVAELQDLYLNKSEYERALSLRCGSECLKPEERTSVYKYFSKIRNEADAKSGTYDVARIGRAIKSETLYKVEDFKSLPRISNLVLKRQFRQYSDTVMKVWGDLKTLWRENLRGLKGIFSLEEMRKPDVDFKKLFEKAELKAGNQV